MVLWLKLTFRGVFYFLTDKNFLWFSILLLLHGDKKRFKRTKVRFRKYKLTVPDSASFIWQIKEIFVQKAYKFVSNAQSPIILDCGANVGTSVLFFKELYPSARITAFEADPVIFKYLEDNLRNNGVSDVALINKAVWISDGTINFKTEGADGATLIIQENVDNVIEVRSVRLKDFIMGMSERIDMLKIDIEGAEVKVIADVQEVLFKVEHLFVEYHSFTQDRQALSQMLGIIERSGFKYFIETAVPRKSPFVNKYYSYNATMDLQLNIFAYR